MVRERNSELASQVALTGQSESLLGQAANDFIERRARGETPNISEYEKKYPEIAAAIRDIFPALDLIGNSASGARGTSDELDSFGPSRRLGDFQILNEIGRGGMGVVYEAEQISMGRRVALKVLPLAGLVDELKIQRFQNEVRAVAALDHPNIVSVYMVGEERGVHYYAMQRIRGRSLADVISSLRKVRDQGEQLTGESLCQVSQHGKEPLGASLSGSETIDSGKPASMSQSVANQRDTGTQVTDSTIPHSTKREYHRSIAALGIQAANALQHAHEQGVIHRDIKPGNLLIDTYAKLYVADFGLARMGTDAGVTMTGDFVGTLRYMAPEQALGKHVEVDRRADIYSLSTTLFELLTLRPAYEAADRQKLLQQIAFSEPPRLRRVDASILVDLETIVLKGMSKDRQDRYASSQELAVDLRLFLDHRPINAKPMGPLRRFGKWTRRNPVITWATLVTLFVIATALGVITVLVARQRDQAISDSVALREANLRTEDHLQISIVTRLAAESRALRDERPIESVLLAIEAVELSQQHYASVLPVAHEALLNATQALQPGRSLSGHGTKISTVAMSAEWLVTLGEERAHLWDLTSRQPWLSSRALGNGDDKITSMALSHDVGRLVTCGSKLQLWDLQTRNPELASIDLSASESPITQLSLSPNGRWLTTRSEDGTARFWDLNDTNRSNSRVISRQSTLVVVGPDGRWVTGVERETLNSVQLWEIRADGISNPITLDGHKNIIRDIAISPDGRWIASAGSDNTIRCWDLDGKNPANSPKVFPAGRSNGVDRLTISADSRWLFAETAYEARILGWDMSAENPGDTPSVLAHRDAVNSMSVSRDGHWLISGSRDGMARVWNLDSEELTTESVKIRAHDSTSSAALHPGRRWIATAGDDGTARLWDLQGSDPTLAPFVLSTDDDDVFSAVAISSSGRWIATSANAKSVYLWDMEARNPSSHRRVLQGRASPTMSVQISPNDRWLVSSTVDGSAQLWNLTSDDIASSLMLLGGADVRKGATTGDPVLDEANGYVALGPHGRWFALAGADDVVRLWDLSAKDLSEPAYVLSGHQSKIESLMFSPDGRWLITGSPNDNGSQLRLWDIEASDPQDSCREVIVSDGLIFATSIDANSRWLATEGPGQTIQLLDLHANDPTTPVRSLPSPAELWGTKSANIWQMAMSPDAHWLFTSRFDSTAQLWDLSKQMPTPHILRGHNGVQSAVISPDGHWLVAGCRSQTHLWDLTAEHPASTARVLRGHQEVIWSVRISADSRWLVTDSSDGTIRRWSLDTEWLLNHARDAVGRDLTDDEREHYRIPVAR